MTSAGLNCLLASLREASRPLSLLNLKGVPRPELRSNSTCLFRVIVDLFYDFCDVLEVITVGIHFLFFACSQFSKLCFFSAGCQVSGPWSSKDLEDLAELVQDLHLCSQGLNKLDRDVLKQIWDRSQPQGRFLDRNSKFLLSAAAST